MISRTYGSQPCMLYVMTGLEITQPKGAQKFYNKISCKCPKTADIKAAKAVSPAHEQKAIRSFRAL